MDDKLVTWTLLGAVVWLLWVQRRSGSSVLRSGRRASRGCGCHGSTALRAHPSESQPQTIIGGRA